YSDGTLQVANSVIRGNWAHGGGGIAARNAVTIVDSTLSGNSAWYISGTSSGHGGGIYLWDGTVRIARSTLSGNSAVWSSVGGYGGGGLYNEAAAVTIANSTVSGNTGSNGMVGGIASAGGTLAVVNSTVTANTGGVGGIFRTGGTTTVSNSIVAGQASGTDCGGEIFSSGSNLDSDGTCALAQVGDISAGFAGLGPLADNGGLTWTHPLLPGSAALDAGDDAVCAVDPVNGVDQRGLTRPVDGDGDGTASCDIGAYEYP
ncbi:MAG TPA: choice-of-anchor Q domain-containing protein, partial [Deferrisomatales bacterium]|nr:choice-of-anchor Q domain-containing protein [Deferrisomatales bacterium]